MSKIKTLGLALVVVLAFSVVGGTSASAHVFKSTEKGTLTGSAMGVQVFTTSAGSVECEEAVPSGTVTSLESATQEVTVTYKKCSAFFSTPVEEPVVAHFLLSAEGWATVTKEVVLKIQGTANCSLKVFGSEQKKNEKLTAVTYKNVSPSIEVLAKIIKIVYKGSGGACGSTESTNGEYEGTILTKLTTSGIISWV